MHCHVLRDRNGAVLALEVVSEPTRAAYGSFAPTAELASDDVDVDPDLFRLLKLRQSPDCLNLKIEFEGGKPRLVSRTKIKT